MFRPYFRAASSAQLSGPAAPPEMITVSAGSCATRRSTVSRSVLRREPTIATYFMDLVVAGNELGTIQVSLCHRQVDCGSVPIVAARPQGNRSCTLPTMWFRLREDAARGDGAGKEVQ